MVLSTPVGRISILVTVIVSALTTGEIVSGIA
jgi:hypothetical protein